MNTNSNLIASAFKSLVRFMPALGKGNARLSALDFGMLEVALMIAALDGTIQPSEADAFDLLAAKARGATPEIIADAFRRALRRAGYLLALAQTRRASEDERLDAFVAEAREALPEGFLAGDGRDLRRAFVIWSVMASSDGDYAPLERRALEALERTFSDLRAANTIRDAAAWSAAYPQFGGTSAAAAVAPEILASARALPEGFLDRVAALSADLGDPAKSAAAEAALGKLIEGEAKD